MAPSCVDTLDDGRQSPAAPIPLSKKIFLVIHFHRVKVILRVGPAAQRLPVTQFLYIAKTCRDSLIAVGGKAIKVHADPAIAPGIHLRLVKDGLYILIHHLRRLLAVGVEEVAVRIRLILRAVNVAVP